MDDYRNVTSLRSNDLW